jgi:uncharacterized membrane protein
MMAALTFDTAQRFTALGIGAAIFQHSIEHFVAAANEQGLSAARALAATCLIFDFHPGLSCGVLVVLHFLLLRRFAGPYNGGSDRMALLGATLLMLSYMLPTEYLRELALGYLALQVVLSYAISGWVKIVNPAWRNGRALLDVFAFSEYPVSENLRCLAAYAKLLFAASWAVMLFELAFPLALMSQRLLLIALAIGASFHLANACLFGLNRFLWIWLATYPSLLWLQARILNAS